MKFKVRNQRKNHSKRDLKYNKIEHAFEVNPYENNIIFDILINYLCLSVNENREIVHVSGYCPQNSWKKMTYNVPEYQRGELEIIDDIEPGFSYRLNSEDFWSSFFNEDSRWLCIGNPEIRNTGVEFSFNSVAVLEKNHIVAIWIKVDKL